MKFSKEELIDLTKSWIVISLAFGLVLSNIRFSNLNFNLFFLVNVLLSALTVGIGFLLHELAHKYVAIRYGCSAEFRSFDQMLIFALIISFTGFVFAAPGAVFISGNVNIERNGRISVAGPITNLIMALIFLLLGLVFTSDIMNRLAELGFFINTWLALFNMIPFWNFDGKKIFYWNKKIWLSVVAIGVFFLVYVPSF